MRQRKGPGGLALRPGRRKRPASTSLKVGYNKVFGYYIEVSKSYYDQVPDTYIRKQTLTNCERFITQELKELEHKILGAQDRITALEFELFCDLLESRRPPSWAAIQRSAAAVAQVDVLSSLRRRWPPSRATAAPRWTSPTPLTITEGRHPVVEQMLKTRPLRPQRHPHGQPRRHGGSSSPAPTWRASPPICARMALIALMAQIGSFVPARSARMRASWTRVFTRIGAQRRPLRRAVHLHGGDDRGGRDAEKRHRQEPADPGRDRPRYLHLRRHEHRPRRGGAHRGPSQGPGLQDPLRHPLPRADRPGGHHRRA